MGIVLLIELNCFEGIQKGYCEDMNFQKKKNSDKELFKALRNIF